MRHGDTQIDEWDVEEVVIDGEPAVKLEMWNQGGRKMTTHYRLEGNTLKPLHSHPDLGDSGFVDEELYIAQQILQSPRYGYEFDQFAAWE